MPISGAGAAADGSGGGGGWGGAPGDAVGGDAAAAAGDAGGPGATAWELYIELPYFPLPVVFDSQVYDNAEATPVPLLVASPAVQKKMDAVRVGATGAHCVRFWCACVRACV